MTLTALDRCDAPRCGAAAYVSALFKAGALLFCAHHWREHSSAIWALTEHVHDETDRLKEKS